MITIITIITYLLVAAYICIYVGYVLYKNGVLFVGLVLREQQAWVVPINKLLLLGYYLVNLGFIIVYLTQAESIENTTQAVEFLSSKLGTVCLALGIMHAINMAVFIYVQRLTTLKSN